MLHGFDSGLRQNRIAPNEFDICNIALPINYGLEKHITSDVILPSLLRIDRVHFVANQTFSHA